MFIACTLHAGGEHAPVRIRNMSPDGALLETPLLPVPGSRVRLVRETLVAEGIVAWTKDKHLGLRFNSAVSVPIWMGRRPSGATPAQRPLGNDLSMTIALLEHLGDELCASAATVAAHPVALQKLDIAVQLLRALQLQEGSEGRLGQLEALRAASVEAMQWR
ncbi:hypothetical protein GCM10007925_21700 [Sphingomonas astaxanthinifaciens DSM 22298]|uniref:PilZ domain-containing protein n=2 Tax=Sphingomonas TaxID=13687 RepID=A0ABQ5Z905_9SPHN|nr:hypothetical protein GCM10007925_21700 [Sphingomonas astaxanthinifaciens DSM 22298]